MGREKKADSRRSRRVSYEIVPGSFFPVPRGLEAASFSRKVKLQRRAEKLISNEILIRLGLAPHKIRASVVRGGWQGAVNPSTQIVFTSDAPVELVRAYAAALGLVWRQDAVAVMRLHPDGNCLAIRISRVDGNKLSGSQIDRFYRVLYEADEAKQATIGFTEHDGSMLFINLPGGLSDKAFESTLVRLAAGHIAENVFLDFARADFELESTVWRIDHGEGYRKRLCEAGRSDLLDWIEAAARDEAERLLSEIGKARRTRRKSRPPD